MAKKSFFFFFHVFFPRHLSRECVQCKMRKMKINLGGWNDSTSQVSLLRRCGNCPAHMRGTAAESRVVVSSP